MGANISRLECAAPPRAPGFERIFRIESVPSSVFALLAGPEDAGDPVDVGGGKLARLVSGVERNEFDGLFVATAEKFGHHFAGARPHDDAIAAPHGGGDVPVIDPIPLAVQMADALVKTGLSHSKRTYPAPGRKRMAGYPFPEYSAAD
jgi:hypothetical protein